MEANVLLSQLNSLEYMAFRDVSAKLKHPLSKPVSKKKKMKTFFLRLVRDYKTETMQDNQIKQMAISRRFTKQLCEK